MHNKVVRVDRIEKVSFELRLEGDREVSQVNIWVENVPGRINGTAKGFSDRLDVGVREREESRMSPKSRGLEKGGCNCH